MSPGPRLGIVATSAVVPRVELDLGVGSFREAGFSVKLHPQCRKRHVFFAGTDEERAQAFLEYAYDPSIDVIWGARGGYGVVRILPLIEKAVEERGKPPRKLLVGYSDMSVLMEYARTRWGWATLHGPMPALREFTELPRADWNALVSLVRGERCELPYSRQKLKFLGPAPASEVRGEVIGGNLTIWASTLGTRFAPPPADGKLLFLEDVTEPLFRIDRLMHQLELVGCLRGARAILLGTFTQCEDSVPSVLKAMPKPAARKRMVTAPKPSELKPLRPRMPQLKALRDIFEPFARRLGIPVAYGLPVGHGIGYSPLPLGATLALGTDGRLRLESWDWLKSSD